MDKGYDETKKYLINFLEEFKGLIYESKIWIKDRKDTQNTLIELGYTKGCNERVLPELR